MQKFLRITGNTAPAFSGQQIVAIEGIKTIARIAGDGSTNGIYYTDGTLTTITTDPTSGMEVMLALQDAVKAALETSWTNPYYDFDMTEYVMISIANA
jgi:hypothetical protein